MAPFIPVIEADVNNWVTKIQLVRRFTEILGFYLPESAQITLSISIITRYLLIEQHSSLMKQSKWLLNGSILHAERKGNTISALLT